MFVPFWMTLRCIVLFSLTAWLPSDLNFSATSGRKRLATGSVPDRTGLRVGFRPNTNRAGQQRRPAVGHGMPGSIVYTQHTSPPGGRRLNEDTARRRRTEDIHTGEKTVYGGPEKTFRVCWPQPHLGPRTIWPLGEEEPRWLEPESQETRSSRPPGPLQAPIVSSNAYVSFKRRWDLIGRHERWRLSMQTFPGMEDKFWERTRLAGLGPFTAFLVGFRCRAFSDWLQGLN